MQLLYSNTRTVTPAPRWAFLALILVIECILCSLVIRAPDLLPPYDGSRPFFLTLLGEVCARQLNLDHLCRLNFDQGSSAVRKAGGCG